MDVMHSAALSASDVAALLQRANLLLFLANAQLAPQSAPEVKRAWRSPQQSRNIHLMSVVHYGGAGSDGSPLSGPPGDRGREGGLGCQKYADGSPTVVAISGAFSQCACLWSPTSFASLSGSEHQFRGGEPLLLIAAVESCKDSDLSAV
jgi:hypothetical protein